MVKSQEPIFVGSTCFVLVDLVRQHRIRIAWLQSKAASSSASFDCMVLYTSPNSLASSVGVAL